MTTELPSILLVDDEAENLRAIERTLKDSFVVTSCTSAKAALAALKMKQFAVILSDQRMPEMTGSQFLAQAAQVQPHASRVILTAFTDAKEMMEAINKAQIYRYVTKPWDNAALVSDLKQAAERYRLINENRILQETLELQVAQRTAELQAANEKLAELAVTDPLTNILNRRGFFQKFSEELERCRRYKHSVAIAMLDLDHFKEYNDMHGHVYGDTALKKTAGILTSNLRKTDVVGRYGGEEFVVFMPETKLDGAEEICERLRAAVEAAAFQGPKENGYLTISIGISIFPSDGETVEELIKAADQAMYHAKQSGRNRVEHEREMGEDETSYFVR